MQFLEYAVYFLLQFTNFFQERGFVYVHTPILTGSDCEGAGEMFQVSSLDFANIPTKENEVDFY